MLDLLRLDSMIGVSVTVMGLGSFLHGSGIGAAKWLMRHGARVTVTDLKSADDLRESVEEIRRWYEAYQLQFSDRRIYEPVLVMGEHRAEDFIKADLVLQNPGVPRESPWLALAQEHGVPIESDVSLFFRYCPWPICAVSGTRGKSTTVSLIGAMCQTMSAHTVVAGNIQRSPLEDLDWLLEAHSPVPVVLELSSWQLESLAKVGRGADVAALTNIFPDHLNRYSSFADYQVAKEIIFSHQTEDQAAVFNADDPLICQIASRVRARQYWFSLHPVDEGCFVEDGKIVTRLNGQREIVCAVSELALAGEHNLRNILAAVLCARLVGVSVSNIANVLQTFTGLPGRQETIAEIAGVRYINDTTATSPEGTIAALQHFGHDKNIVLIAGGASKGLSFEGLAAAVVKNCCLVVLLEGSATDALAVAIGDQAPTVRVASMAEAVSAAQEAATPGSIVLLSPSTASFGLFKNEFDRGEQFVALVQNLSATAPWPSAARSRTASNRAAD